ncbi:MAG: hypothetical protein WC700_17040 [Gemmatimonadaceae bacterium]
MTCPTCGADMICQTETNPPTTPVFDPWCPTCHLARQNEIRRIHQVSVDLQLAALMDGPRVVTIYILPDGLPHPAPREWWWDLP